MVKATEYSVRDANGRVLCHSEGQSKRNADSRRKRAVREGFARMCAAAGIVDGEGRYMDVHTGGYFPMADGDTPNDELVVIDRGHVTADDRGGAFCPCNLVPELRGMNKAHGSRALDPRDFHGVDPRGYWFEVWAEHYARPSQRRVAVDPQAEAIAAWLTEASR